MRMLWRAAIGVIGLAVGLLLLLRGVAPVVRLLLRRVLLVRRVRTRVSGRRVLLMTVGPVTRLRWWRRVPRVVRHVAGVLFLE